MVTLPPDKVFRVGDLVHLTGIYRATHGDHRLAHEVILVSGDKFPRCKKCADIVTFTLITAAPLGPKELRYRVRLYEIPHPEPNGDSENAA